MAVHVDPSALAGDFTLPVFTSTNVLAETGVTITASSEMAGRLAQVLLEPETFTYWQASVPAWSVTAVLPGVRDIDYVAIAGHDFEASGGGTLELLLNATGTTEAGSVAVDAVQAADLGDGVSVFLFPRQPVRSITLRDQSGGAGTPRIAVMAAGHLLTMPTPIFGGVQMPGAFSPRVEAITNRSLRGEVLGGVVRRQGFEASAMFDYLEADFVEGQVMPFVRFAQEAPFFYAPRPRALPGSCGYCAPLDTVIPQPMEIGAQWFSVAFPLEGVF